ncbi:DUF5050 domain-containing protein [Paenibacillus etheri]|nr:DUF5050 domain-containing protein [Paenibacillus etheri]
MKKMFFLQKHLLFILLYLIFSLFLFFLDKPVNPDVEMNAALYSSYLQQVKGRYTEQTEEFFMKEAIKISNAKVALQNAIDDYYDGEIEEGEFLAASSPLEQLLKKEIGFQLVYDQFTYIREHPADRYFLYRNGWDGLLSNEKLDLLWVLLVLQLVTPMFCFEYESGMDKLLLTVRKGNFHHTICKISLTLLTISLLSLLMSGMRYAFYQLKYGLENGGYPLQSLSYFSTSTRDFTLFEAFLLMAFGKLFGSLILALLILFLSVCLKRYTITMFFCTGVILLPYYALHLESSKYVLPGPLGFLLSSGYLRGTEYERDSFTDQLTMVFKEVSFTTFMTVFGATLLLCFIMLVVIFIRRSNTCSAVNSRWRGKSLILFMVLGMVVLLSSSCASNQNSEASASYNFSTRHSFENKSYSINVDETDLDNTRIVFEDKQTGEQRDIIRNAMSSLTEIQNIIYCNGTHIYYIKYDLEEKSKFVIKKRFFVIELDIKTFSERIIFEKNVSGGKDNLLGLNNANLYDTAFFFSIQAFFLDEQNIYFAGSDEIRSVNRVTGVMEVILRIPIISSLAFDGNTIYYINSKLQVVRYDIKRASETVISDLVTRSFLLSDNDLIYINRKDHQKLYTFSLLDTVSRKLTELPVLSFRCEGQKIIYMDNGSLKEHELNRTETGNRQ